MIAVRRAGWKANNKSETDWRATRAYQAADELSLDSRERFTLSGVTLGVTFVLA